MTAVANAAGELGQLIDKAEYKAAAALVEQMQRKAGNNRTTAIGPLNLLKARCLLVAEDFTSLEHLLKTTKTGRNRKNSASQKETTLQLEQAYLYYRTNRVSLAAETLKKLDSVSLKDRSYDSEEVECLKAQIYYKIGDYEKAA